MATEAKPTRTWVLTLTSVASLMVALDLLVVSTALSTIRLDLDPRSRSCNGRSPPAASVSPSC